MQHIKECEDQFDGFFKKYQLFLWNFFKTSRRFSGLPLIATFLFFTLNNDVQSSTSSFSKKVPFVTQRG